MGACRQESGRTRTCVCVCVCVCVVCVCVCVCVCALCSVFICPHAAQNRSSQCFSNTLSVRCRSLTHGNSSLGLNSSPYRIDQNDRTVIESSIATSPTAPPRSHRPQPLYEKVPRPLRTMPLRSADTRGPFSVALPPLVLLWRGSSLLSESRPHHFAGHHWLADATRVRGLPRSTKEDT